MSNHGQLFIKFAFIFQQIFSIWIPFQRTPNETFHFEFKLYRKLISGTSSIQFKILTHQLTVRVQVVTATGGYFLRSWGSQVQTRFRRYNTEQSVPRVHILLSRSYALSTFSECSTVQFTDRETSCGSRARHTFCYQKLKFPLHYKNVSILFIGIILNLFFGRILSPLLLHGCIQQISKQQRK